MSKERGREGGGAGNRLEEKKKELIIAEVFAEGDGGSGGELREIARIEGIEAHPGDLKSVMGGGEREKANKQEGKRVNHGGGMKGN